MTLKMLGERLSGSMQFASNGVSRLLRKMPDLLVTELLISHQKQNEPILFRKGIECFPDALPQFFGFEHAQRIIAGTGRALPDGVVGIAEHVPVVP